MRKTFTWLAMLGAVSLAAPLGALASGPGSSAGDQQYVDPLATSTTTATATPPTAPPSPPTASQPAPAAQSSEPSSTPAEPSAPASTPAQSTAPQASSQQSSAAPSPQPAGGSAARSTTTDPTLPYTGLDTWLIAAVGVLLLGAGVAVRCVVWKRTDASRR
jgi:outer membrane biosynthesis protein TonB